MSVATIKGFVGLLPLCVTFPPVPQLAQKEEMVVALRVKLQDHEEDARVLRQQLLSSQDALQQVTAELRSCKREREKQVRK